MKRIKKITLLLGTMSIMLIPLKNNSDSIIINNAKTQCFSQLKRMVRAGNDDPFDIALNSYEDLLNDVMNIDGYNRNYYFKKPFNANGDRNGELNGYHYNTYKTKTKTVFDQMDAEAKTAFNNLRNQNAAINDFGKLIDSNYSSSTINELQRSIDFEISDYMVDYVERVSEKQFNSITTEFVNTPTQYFGLDGILYENAVTRASGFFFNSFQMLATALIGLGLTEFAVATLEGASITIQVTAVAPILAWIKAIIIVAAIVAIVLVLVSYWSQISLIWNEIVSYFVNSAPSGYSDKFESVFTDAGTTASSSASAGYRTIDGKKVYADVLNMSLVNSLQQTATADQYFYAFTSLESYSQSFNMQQGYQYLFVVTSMPLDINLAALWLASNKKHNVYSICNTSAYDVLLVSHSQYQIIGPENHSQTQSNYGTYFWHYHPNIGNGDRPHSFFGIPIIKKPSTSFGGC